MLEYITLAFENSPLISGYVVVSAEGEIAQVSSLLPEERYTKLMYIAAGGRTRASSVKNAVSYMAASCISPQALILVHDGARPLLPEAVIHRVIAALRREECAVAAAVPAVDTTRLVDADGHVVKTLPRERLRIMQTPQGASLRMLLAAFEAPQNVNLDATDDLEILANIGCPLRLVAGDSINFKVTTAADLRFANSLLHTAKLSFR